MAGEAQVHQHQKHGDENHAEDGNFVCSRHVSTSFVDLFAGEIAIVAAGDMHRDHVAGLGRAGEVDRAVDLR